MNNILVGKKIVIKDYVEPTYTGDAKKTAEVLVERHGGQEALIVGVDFYQGFFYYLIKFNNGYLWTTHLHWCFTIKENPNDMGV